jgi:hypothetical protein
MKGIWLRNLEKKDSMFLIKKAGNLGGNTIKWTKDKFLKMQKNITQEMNGMKMNLEQHKQLKN